MCVSSDYSTGAKKGEKNEKSVQKTRVQTLFDIQSTLSKTETFELARSICLRGMSVL